MSFIGDVIGDALFDGILEPIGASVRFVLFRLRGKKVKFRDVMPIKDEENKINNEIVNRIVGACFLVSSSVVIALLFN